MNQICFNGKMMPVDMPVLPASNRGYRYGDGLFETMKIVNGKIQFRDDHFERLFSGLSTLQFVIPALFTNDKLEKQVLELCKKNDCEELARVRLSVTRGNGGLYDEHGALQWMIESWPLNKMVNQLNENGLEIGVYPDARKSCDKFSNLKSANFLVYTMAALYAKENKLNDCLVLNTHNNIADSTIANIFLVHGDTISTPALSEGCVNGIMRKNLLAWFQQQGQAAREIVVTTADVENADEMFLTNAIRGIQWVGRYGDKRYTNKKTVEIFNRFVKTISTW